MAISIHSRVASSILMAFMNVIGHTVHKQHNDDVVFGVLDNGTCFAISPP